MEVRVSTAKDLEHVSVEFLKHWIHGVQLEVIILHRTAVHRRFQNDDVFQFVVKEQRMQEPCTQMM